MLIQYVKHPSNLLSPVNRINIQVQSKLDSKTVRPLVGNEGMNPHHNPCIPYSGPDRKKCIHNLSPGKVCVNHSWSMRKYNFKPLNSNVSDELYFTNLQIPEIWFFQFRIWACFIESKKFSALTSNNLYMDVSKNSGTPKWMVYNGKLYQTILKWMIWGYHYFWKHPYIILMTHDPQFHTRNLSFFFQPRKPWSIVASHMLWQTTQRRIWKEDVGLLGISLKDAILCVFQVVAIYS